MLHVVNLGKVIYLSLIYSNAEFVTKVRVQINVWFISWQDLEFHGVMRFYFQDSGQKVATKCIRVPSTANSRTVIETLVEKFRPDMRMLSIPEYALYEIHENGGRL